MAIELNSRMNTGLHNASRLIRSETMHQMNEINKVSMKESGVTKVQEIVTLDERTSSECSPHNKKIHDIDKAPILPRHPNCRCVLVPYIDVDKVAEEFDRREDEIKNPIVEELESEKFDRRYLDLQFFAKEKPLNKYSLEEFSEDKFKHSVNVGKLNHYGKISEKIITNEVIVTRERVDHILEGHEELKGVTFN